MKIGIIGAMEQEVQILRGKIEGLTETVIGKTVFYEGKIDNHDVILARSGIGKVQAGLTAAILAYRNQPDVIINTGSAGGIGPDLAIGDLVIASGVAYHDVDLTAFGDKPGQLPDQPQIFESDQSLVKRIEQASTEKTHTGLIVTGDQFIASSEKIANILSIFPKALASEMEGAAIAQVATQFKIPFVVVRAMSDVGDESASVNFDDFIVEAGKQSAAMILRYIEGLN